MDFTHSDRAVRLTDQVRQFVRDEIEPRDEEHAAFLRESPWAVPPVVEELKQKARAAGLWNLFLPDPELGAGLSNVEYAPMAEAMGAYGWAPEVLNSNAPDTGNAEVLLHYGSTQPRQQWR
ncbi:acyl-CoA dehydrogenase family protein, partial [Nocardia abscessus]|uniref:acyl-CoA dehydrogenase family protein n=1 Tax=Nocardia abscessus TaxID=120957 RepID=UPI0024547F63